MPIGNRRPGTCDAREANAEFTVLYLLQLAFVKIWHWHGGAVLVACVWEESDADQLY